MRELVLTALIACVHAAPSIIAPYPYTLPVAPNGSAPLSSAPTISPGDLEAVAIDTQVKLADQARYRSDESKEEAELLAEQLNLNKELLNDLEKEKVEEALWAAEEKKWQAVNEAQIAEAKLAGSIASKVASEAETAEIKSETTEMKTEEKMEIKSEATEAEIKAKYENKIEATEIETEGKLETKVADTEKIAEAKMPVEAMKEDTVEVKAVTPKKLEDALEAFKTASEALAAIAPGISFQPYVAPTSYNQYLAFSSHPFQHLPAFPYLPALAVKNVW